MRAIDIVRRLCPRAQPAYVAAFEAGDAQLRAAGITTPRRLAHFLAQVFHETGGLTITEESLRYSARRLCEVWPKRFPTIDSALPYAWDPSDPDREDIALADKVYGGRMGNETDGTDDDDGWTYRGRGLFQTTGREAYAEWGRRLGIDLVAHPDLILSAAYALAPAIYEWSAGGCNARADRDDLRGITRIINGGLIGLDDRAAWLRRIEAAIGDAEISFALSATPELPASSSPSRITTVAPVGAALVVATGAAHRFDAPVAVFVGLAIAAVIAVAVVVMKRRSSH